MGALQECRQELACGGSVPGCAEGTVQERDGDRRGQAGSGITELSSCSLFPQTAQFREPTGVAGHRSHSRSHHRCRVITSRCPAELCVAGRLVLWVLCAVRRGPQRALRTGRKPASFRGGIVSMTRDLPGRSLADRVLSLACTHVPPNNGDTPELAEADVGGTGGSSCTTNPCSTSPHRARDRGRPGPLESHGAIGGSSVRR